MGEVVEKELVVPNDTAYLSEVRRAVLDVVGTALFSPGEAQLLALAVDEAVANVMEHAYGTAKRNKQQFVQLLLSSKTDRFEAVIRDRGRAFDPRSVPDVNIQQHVREGHRGGLGIFLIRHIVDKIEYTAKRGSSNELRLTKFVDNPANQAKSNPTPASQRSP